MTVCHLYSKYILGESLLIFYLLLWYFCLHRHFKFYIIKLPIFLFCGFWVWKLVFKGFFSQQKLFFRSPMFISKAFIFLYSWRSSLSSKDRLVLPKIHFLQKGVDKHWTKLIHFAFHLPPLTPHPLPRHILKTLFPNSLNYFSRKISRLA